MHQRPSAVKICFFVAALSALGYLGNVYSLPVGFSVTFLFGSIFVVIAVYFLGSMAGLATAMLSASYTYILWNHPYAIIVFACEALWLGFHLRKRHLNVVIIDAMYWLIIGLPLVFLFYYKAMSLGLTSASIIFLKQAINGIFNALIASMMIDHLPLAKIFYGESAGKKLVSYANVIFHLTAAFLMVPTITLLLSSNYRELKSMQQVLCQLVEYKAKEAEVIVESWLSRHIYATQLIAELGSRYSVTPSPQLQADLHLLKVSFPDFHNVYIADSHATTIAFFPDTNEKGASTIGLNFSDREYFRQLKSTQKPYISDVFQGRGGIFLPIFSISSPIISDGAFIGFGLGAINLNKLRILLNYHSYQKDFSLTIYDKKHNIVCSTKLERQPLSKFSMQDSGQIIKLGSSAALWIPSSKKNISEMDIWRDAVYFVDLPVQGTSWTLLAEVSVAPFQSYLYERTIAGLSIVTLLFFLAIFISYYISRWFARSPGQLAVISRDLQSKLEGQSEIVWPESEIREMSDLIENFKDAAAGLQRQFKEIQVINNDLEHRVEDRTRQLNELTQNLSLRVEQEIALRRKNEETVLQQSKLAAMGEMIGAIAHQWRQPLNALGLGIQNVRELYSRNELNRDQVDLAAKKAMDHINLMSRTIDDFRNFFSPDRDKTAFNTIAAVEKVLSLFSAQLSSHDIDYVLVCPTHVKICKSREQAVPSAKFLVEGYKNEFEHVVLNIISNAKDAILEKRNYEKTADWTKGIIRIEFMFKDSTVLIKFSNNGIGIKQEVRDRIFEPYFTTKEQSKGTGLGLYMAKVIIQEHMNGRIYLDADLEDATFCIELPLTAKKEV